MMEFLDGPVRSPPPSPPPSGTIVLRVDGMHCGHCTGMVDRALRDVAGVTEVEVELDSAGAGVDGRATIQGQASPDALIAAVTAVGKTAELLSAPPPPPTEVCTAATSFLFHVTHNSHSYARADAAPSL